MEEFSHLLAQIVISAIPVLFAITLHETAHGWVANRLGDPTARLQGRLTLNPIPHIDPIMTILLPIVTLLSTGGRFIFGGAKPVPVNFNNLRNPKRDMILVAAAGPGINLLMAATAGCLFRLMTGFKPEIFSYIHSNHNYSAMVQPAMGILVPLSLMCLAAVKWNVLLAVFNMIPVPPLDGGRVLVGFLPHSLSEKLAAVEPYGIFIVMFLIFFGPVSQILFQAVLMVSWLLVGINPFML